MTFKVTVCRPREPAYSIRLQARDRLEAAAVVRETLEGLGRWDDRVRVRIVALASPETGSSDPCQNGHTPSDLHTVASILRLGVDK